MLHIVRIQECPDRGEVTLHVTDDGLGIGRYRIDLDVTDLRHMAAKAKASKGRKSRGAGGALVMTYVGETAKTAPVIASEAEAVNIAVAISVADQAAEERRIRGD